MLNSSLSSAMALPLFRQAKSADEEAKLVESAVPKSLEQWQKQRLIKVPNVEVSGLFKDYDFHLVQSLDTSLIEMNALSLNYWLSTFVQEVAKSSSVHGLFLL